jgi:hypothetical protein
MIRKRRRYHIDQIDDSNILQDGEILRVPMILMDAAASPPRRSPTNPTQVTDGTGDPLGLHRPGPRIVDGGNEATQMMRDANRDWRDAAYATYEAELTAAWKTPSRIGEGSNGFGIEASEEYAPHRRAKRMDELYQERDHELRNEWRKGRQS